MLQIIIGIAAIFAALQTTGALSFLLWLVASACVIVPAVVVAAALLFGRK